MNAPNPHSILIADDEPAVCLIASRVLEMSGYSVTVVNSGQEVVDHYAGGDAGYSLLLLDLSMPKPSGTELISAIRVTSPELPIVLMSGFDEHSAMARANGATAFLQKPFRGPDLLEVAGRYAGTPNA